MTKLATMGSTLSDRKLKKPEPLDRKLETGSATRDLSSGDGDGLASGSSPSNREENTATGTLQRQVGLPSGR
jgi:hypothetical protein